MAEMLEMSSRLTVSLIGHQRNLDSDSDAHTGETLIVNPLTRCGVDIKCIKQTATNGAYSGTPSDWRNPDIKSADDKSRQSAGYDSAKDHW